MMNQIIEDIVKTTRSAIHDTRPTIRIEETGHVLEVKNSIARVAGLKGTSNEELLEFPGGLLGIATELGDRDMGILLLGRSDNLKAGDEVRRTGRQIDVPVGRGLLGRVLNASGEVLDQGPDLHVSERWPVERDAPAILDRAPVTTPLQTGLKIVDSLIPIGRGQRELIIGDRQTGKTSVAVNAILNQAGTGVLCIYCAIGQRATAVARVVETLKEGDAMAQTIVMVALGEDRPGLQFITPYAATSVAEYFVEQGRDVLLVFDDLTRHARAYRELSLLLRRPPGREAYPGDIFYIHARLLERAAQLHSKRGGGSLTVLPIVETQAQDISAFIPTNLISITDGQIYLSSQMFRKGIMPAIDIGLSVSRVGSKAQIPAYRKVAGDLRLSYTQFGELEEFARFGTRLDEATRAAIEQGKRVREILQQDEFTTLSASLQVAVLYALTSGLMDEVQVAQIRTVEAKLFEALQDSDAADKLQRFASTEAPQDADWRWLHDVLVAEIKSAMASDNRLERQ